LTDIGAEVVGEDQVPARQVGGRDRDATRTHVYAAGCGIRGNSRVGGGSG
jgi:hypothetical protein